METPTNSRVTILRKVTVKNIDIALSEVKYKKRVGYQTNWFESGKDLIELLEADRLNRFEEAKKRYQAWGRSGLFNPENYEKFDFYFPAAKGYPTAAKHFQKMVEIAPSMVFETVKTHNYAFA